MKLSAAELVFAIAHEVGNHLGGIRLQAHLLDEDLDARELAGASVLIDELAGRSGPLLSLLRPLLADVWQEAGGAPLWSTVIAGVERQLQDEGTRGTAVEFAPFVGGDGPAPDHDWLHPLLIALLGATVSHVGRDGRIRVTFESIWASGHDVLEVADDGPEERLDDAAAARGRPLVVALAKELVGRLGGSVDAARDGGETRVRLHFPRPGGASGDASSGA